MKITMPNGTVIEGTVNEFTALAQKDINPVIVNIEMKHEDDMHEVIRKLGQQLRAAKPSVY
jgi:hypothetical protein